MNNLKYLTILKESKILAGLNDQQLMKLIDSQKLISFNKDHVIFEQDSIGDTMYIVLEGEVILLIDPEKVTKQATIGSIGLRSISKIKPAQSFGELSLFDKKSRSVTAIANTDTTLLAISSDFFAVLFGKNQDNTDVVTLILQNIISDISTKLRSTNANIIEEMLSIYFVKTLVEELQYSPYECSYVNPLKRQVVVHVPEHFILSPYIDSAEVRKKELIDIYFITNTRILKKLLDNSYPSGEVIVNTLLSVIRSGKVPARVNHDAFAVDLFSTDDFRKGTLKVYKTIHNKPKQFFIDWELKGVINNTHQKMSYANLFLTIAEDNKEEFCNQADNIIKAFVMPIQSSICSLLPKNNSDKKIHLIIIHHRTDEVVNTTQHLKKLGYMPDVLIGIPYGEVDWKTIITLDYCSNHTFQTLKTILDRKQPIKYVFDFKASSFLPLAAEKALLKLFADPAVNSSYLSAMEALIEYSLVKILKTCAEKDEKLIVFEDGGYIANLIYRVYHDPKHHLYALIKKAVDEKILIGIVEGTMSGEKVHRKYLSAHPNALYPVLSSAASQLKILFESKGIAESIIHAATTALGRMGLPAFQERRMVVIGGNGTIGRRVIEQLVAMHNGTSEVTIVDISPLQKLPKIPNELCYLNDRIRYTNLPRYSVDELCEYFWLSNQVPVDYNEFSETKLYKRIISFLNNKTAAKRFIFLNYGTLNHHLESLLKYILSQFNINFERHLGFNQEIAYDLSDTKKIIFLAKNTLLSTDKLDNFIVDNVDTIIGVTGVNVIKAAEIVSFLKRKNAEAVDQIIFVSGSSKDNEFKDGLAFLDALLSFHTDKKAHDQYKEYLVGLLGNDLEKTFNITKHIHKDVGISYHIDIDGQTKILHMLANGLVINFFAKHEKGAKSEYIDPIVTLQLLSVIRLAQGAELSPGLYDAAKQVGDTYHEAILLTINEKCKPIFDSEE